MFGLLGYKHVRQMKSDDANPSSVPLHFQLVASIVFISFGVVAAFCCAIVDGVFAARHIVSNFKSFFLINFKKKKKDILKRKIIPV